jgi:hypothetical protein
MGDQKAQAAIARIERALARIEAAASRPPSVASGGDAEAAELRRAHQALRGKVEGAVAQLDRLLAGSEQG